MTHVTDILKTRGLFEDVTSDALYRALESPVTLYAGFDPSSDSLQVGNFVTIMALSHFQRCGHRVVAVVGGATGMIGDPSGKRSERQLLGKTEIARNQEGIRENLSRFLDFEHPTAPAVIVNNYDWLASFSFVDFLRDVGKHFRMGPMLGKESVRARLASEAGMSFTEFSYQLLQAYDFLHLSDEFGCSLQVGGSDQWGNITAGIDLIRRSRARETFGLTTPLVCDSSGQKFGKSEGNAIYLSANRTSTYDFYQFFLRTTDEDVIRFLKTFTFVPLDVIEDLASAVRDEPEARLAQRRLAEEVTRAVHGDEGLRVAQQATGVLFGAPLSGLTAENLLTIFADVGSAELPRSQVAGSPVLDVAAASGLCKSKGEARRLIQNRGLYLNNERVEGIDAAVADDNLIDGRLLVLRSGRKTFHLVKIV